MPEISVIVPVFRVEQYLCRCVDSVLAQTFEGFELILVDDGSPDRCPEMCDAYQQKDERVVVIHQPNGGLSHARNTGISAAKGNYITFVDSDDCLHRQYLELLYRAAKDNEAEIAACKFVPFQTEEELKSFGEEIAAVPVKLYTNLQALERLCTEKQDATMVVACCKLYQRNLFEQVQFPVGKLHEDEFTTYKLLYQANMVVVVEAPLYYYFANQEGITKSGYTPKRIHAVEALEERVAFLREHGLDSLYKAEYLNFLNYICYLDRIVCENKDAETHRKLRFMFCRHFPIAKKELKLPVRGNCELYSFYRPWLHYWYSFVSRVLK